MCFSGTKERLNMKKNLKGKIAVLVLAIIMMFALAACSESSRNFLKNGWDYEANGYKFTNGVAPGIDDEGNESFYAYSMKGYDAYGRKLDVHGENAVPDPKEPATDYDYWFYEWSGYTGTP